MVDMYEFYFSGGEFEVPDVSFSYSGLCTPEIEAEVDRAVVAPLGNRLKYLRGKYKPFETRDKTSALFIGGCLSWVEAGAVKFRNRSEWFRKLVSDLVFAQEWGGTKNVQVHIPLLVLRDLELPLMKIWAHENQLPFAEAHQEAACRVIHKYPLEKALDIKHRASRKYLLAYYYRRGRLTWEEYKYWRKR